MRRFAQCLLFASSSLAACIAASACADEVRLVGGDVLKGTIVSETDTSVTLDHAALGRIEIARERISEVAKTPPAKPATAKEPAVAAAPEPAAAPPVAVLPAPAPPAPAKPDGSWKFSLALGMTGSRNESQSNWDFRFAGTAKRETEVDRTSVLAEYYFRTNKGTNTDNNFSLKATEDFLFKDSKWEAFVQGTYQYDEFQAWDQRYGLYLGPAYRVLEGEPLSLRLRAGAGISYEVADQSWTPELLFGDELVWKIDERSNLKQGLDLFPDISNVGEYRLVLRLDYEIALSPKGDLKGTAGTRYEYDSYVEPDERSTTDLKVYAGIKVEF